jgi:prefoldin subunit 2
MSADQLENELIRKVAELQQEAKEHQLVLDAFISVEPERKCYRLIGGVLIEKTVKEVKPSLEENLCNVCAFSCPKSSLFRLKKPSVI